MKLRKELFKIFGPVFLAAFLLGVFLVAPLSSKKIDNVTLKRAALSQSANIFKGTIVKQTALEKNYVPFFGSSEFSRIDAFHPFVLAQKYKRPYRPFLLGAMGAQSLSQFFGMQEINAQLKDKKAVFVISPQWFVKQGIAPGAFALYYSNLQAVTWLLDNQDKNTEMQRYAAKRLLQMPSAHSDKMIENCIQKKADGQNLSEMQLVYLKLRRNQLMHEDQLFSTLKLNDRRQLIKRVAKALPDNYDFADLDQLAYQIGQKKTDNNQFEISNNFWNKRLKKTYRKLAGEQASKNYVASPEFADFQLVLNQFAKNHTDVLFVIPPVNRQWSNFTGLSLKMLTQFNEKIRYQLESQGFHNIADLSKDGAEKYFMQDTIHLGWRGWLKMDQYVAPFLMNKQKQPTYQINDKFYSKKWQDLQGQALNDYLKQQTDI